MKKKNSTAQLKKANFKKKFLKDSKINSLYIIFRNELYSQIKNQKFCIGVSGGPDSLALAFLSKVYSIELGNKFVALIVDHNLRKESKSEAQKIKKNLIKHKIKTKILTWKGAIPKSNIQFNARKIRYLLLNKECKKMKINNLVLAHHKSDLIENFFIRLFRGSGLKGLSSLNIKKTFDRQSFNLIRPLLNIDKNDLVYISRKIFKFYINDPTNYKEKFLRTRIRNYLNKFEQDGFELNKLKLTLNNLQMANESIDYYVEKSLKKHIRYLKNNMGLVNFSLFRHESEEVIFRNISDIISKIGGNYYPPRGKEVKNLIIKTQNDNFKKATLGGCIIEKDHNILIFRRERGFK